MQCLHSSFVGGGVDSLVLGKHMLYIVVELRPETLADVAMRRK